MAQKRENDLEALIGRYLAHWRKADIAGILSVCSRQIKYHDLTSGMIVAYDELAQFLQDTFALETESQLVFNSIAYPNQNSAFIHWTQHLKPAGHEKSVSIGGVELIVIEAGEILSIHEFYDYRPPAQEEAELFDPNLQAEQMRKLGLTEPDIVHLIERLEQYFKTMQPYLNANINLTSVSRALNITRNQLSFVINHGLKTSFYEWVNTHRILHIIQDMPPQPRPYSIVAAALEAGFNSISGFYTAFKKQTGITPSAYRKQLPPEEK